MSASEAANNCFSTSMIYSYPCAVSEPSSTVLRSLARNEEIARTTIFFKHTVPAVYSFWWHSCIKNWAQLVCAITSQRTIFGDFVKNLPATRPVNAPQLPLSTVVPVPKTRDIFTMRCWCLACAPVAASCCVNF